MTKTAQMIHDCFQDQLDECRGTLKKLRDYQQDVSFSYWAGWNAMEYINAEFTMNMYETLQKSLLQLASQGKTDEEIVKWLEECREHMVEDILKARYPSSTNQLSNLIDTEKMDVLRKVAGCGLFENGSLAYLLLKLKNASEKKR
jgi:hypothetical protein